MTGRRRLYRAIRLACLLLQVLALGASPLSRAQGASAVPPGASCCGTTGDMAPCHEAGGRRTNDHANDRAGVDGRAAARHDIGPGDAACHDGARAPSCCHAHGVASAVALPATSPPIRGLTLAGIRVPPLGADIPGRGADWLPPRRPPRPATI